MIKKYFSRPACPACPDYYNRGNKVQWRVGYELTGEPAPADNKPGAEGGDVLGWQVKSPKASLVEHDNCDGYIFGFHNAEFFYEMTHEEFAEFVSCFAYIDRDSKTGKSKLRIKNDSAKMRKWLDERA